MNSLPDDFWGRVVYLLQQYGPSFLRGAGTTMLIAVISTAVGCLIGFGVGIVQTTPTDKAHPVKYFLMKVVRFLLGAYVEIFRGTPMMVQPCSYIPALPSSLIYTSAQWRRRCS